MVALRNVQYTLAYNTSPTASIFKLENSYWPAVAFFKVRRAVHILRHTLLCL